MASVLSNEVTGKLADPEFRRERASKAARASHSLGAHVRAIVAKADDLTAEHRRELALMLAEGPKP
jgi:hypothetical protein